MVMSFIPKMVNADSFSHEVEYLRLVETHMSWVFLTGRYAYKIKKPVDLGFADFSTLERRKYFCERELQLNRQMAPQLYIGVVPIGGSAAKPQFGATPATEYAVKMYEFDQSKLLIRLLEADRLERRDMVVLGSTVARMHDNAQVAVPESKFGRVRTVVKPIADNYRDLIRQKLPPSLESRLDRQCSDDFARVRQLRATFTARRREGWIRDCHGDLHLGNLLRIDGRVIAFDRLEFDPELRWIDVMNEAAFPFMDLCYRDRGDLAYEYLNSYCAQSGDYAGLAVLRVYASYKSMIRAKVSAYDGSLGSREREEKIETHLQCAEQMSRVSAGRVVLMHGLSCSGKSFVSNALKVALPAILIRSDIERKRTAGLGRSEDSHSGVGAGIYNDAKTRKNYMQLRLLARSVLVAGFDVIVDGTFLQAWQRELFYELVTDLSGPLLIVDCQAPRGLLRSRLDARSADGNSTSEADHAVLDWQLQHAQALSERELQRTIIADTSETFDCAAAVSAIRSVSNRGSS